VAGAEATGATAAAVVVFALVVVVEAADVLPFAFAGAFAVVFGLGFGPGLPFVFGSTVPAAGAGVIAAGAVTGAVVVAICVEVSGALAVCASSAAFFAVNARVASASLSGAEALPFFNATFVAAVVDWVSRGRISAHVLLALPTDEASVVDGGFIAGTAVTPAA
jgi:hypothetical protein